MGGEISKMRVEKICGGLGFSSIINGADMHYIDTCALADPLLARIPAKYNKNWRIGHFIRQIPIGYDESILANKNMLKDENIKQYYDDIRTITRDKIFSIDRLRLIIKMNFGLYKKPDLSKYRFEEIG